MADEPIAPTEQDQPVTDPGRLPAWNRQRSSPMPYRRYRPAEQRVRIPRPTGRRWPDVTLTAAPLWASVDLRDGNQALPEPMDPDRKKLLFDLLVGIGIKEIEVGYPSASKADFDFVRGLATGDAVPDDVLPVVFTPARQELIERTFESIAGHRRAVVHLCAATAPVWREVVFRADRHGVRRMILDAARDVLDGARRLQPGTDVRFQFSPEVFNLTEPDYVLEICAELVELWEATPQRPVTLNLPTTVETTTPNRFADQIEYMHRELSRRDSVILSIHPHNDRGTAVASAELALLAGADRVEGCLFGNGERTGNVDLVTLALNLLVEGVDPMLDLSDIDGLRRTVEFCNQLPVPVRHPYAGDLVYSAFSGTHQDAIDKGLAHHAARAAGLGQSDRQAPWEVPYLPIDPADVGRDYTAVIRINSQSGKGGVGHVLASQFGLLLPRPMHIEFARMVQQVTDATGREVAPDALWELLCAHYRDHGRPVTLTDWKTRSDTDAGWEFAGTVHTPAGALHRTGAGPGPAQACSAALRGAGLTATLLDSGTQLVVPSTGAAGTGPARTLGYAHCADGPLNAWGIGIDPVPEVAAVLAVLSAVNRLAAR